MQGSAKHALASVLIIIILVSVYFIVAHLAGWGDVPRPSTELAGRKIEKINIETNETLTLTLREWTDLGKIDGKHKHPDTGKYVMVRPMVCSECGKKIPWPSEDRTKYGAGVPEKDVSEDPFEDYVCPFCGKRPTPDYTPALSVKAAE